jgi:hypothetical protein
MSEANLPNHDRPECASKVDNRYPPDGDLRVAVRDFLRENKTPCSSWFTAKQIAAEMGETSKAIGVCLMAIHRDPHGDVRIPRVRERSSFNRYMVTLQ